ncbi:MAG TPA: permease prefix domain 1-containing protein [Clostridia bacterium]|nr:permease prefix domain 1-containing protein [Clostridia bacterium]
MENKLRASMDYLFREVPPTVKASDLKEEILRNMTDRYRDLLATGMDEQKAFDSVISSIGDVSELLETLEESETEETEFMKRAKKRSALLTAVAIMLYILSPIPVLLSGSSRSPLGIVLMFVMVAIATGMLVYNNMTRPKYVAKGDDMVKEFRFDATF